jgi:hypothetical protein
VTWWTDTGRPDTFVVAHAARAGSRWLRLADIVIQPAQRTLPLAEETAGASLAQWSGCALTAVHVDELGHLLCWRDSRQKVIRTDANSMDPLWWCAIEYIGRLLADPLPHPHNTGVLLATGVGSGTRAPIGAS